MSCIDFMGGFSPAPWALLHPGDLWFSFGITMLICLAVVVLFSILARRVNSRGQRPRKVDGKRRRRRER